MAIVSEVEVTDSYWNQDRKRYDYAGKPHERTHYYDAANLANEPAYLPSRFDIVIHLQGDATARIPDPEKWLKDARFKQRFGSRGKSAGIDVFDLPGLQRMQLLRADEEGLGAKIVLSFVDFTEASKRIESSVNEPPYQNFDAQSWIQRIQDYKSTTISKKQLRNHLTDEQEMWKASMEAESVNEAFADAIIGRLHINGMMTEEAAEHSLQSLYHLNSDEARQWLNTITDYLDAKEQSALSQDDSLNLR